MNWTDKIAAHYEKNWQVPSQVCLFTEGPINQLPVDFKVVIFPPHEGRSLWTYATCGMSQPGDAVPVELHLFSPTQDIQLVELLFMIAHFHRTGSKLNLWHTVNFGRPWLSNSLCSNGLISLPYLDGHELENLMVPVGTIKFYWLIPITQGELELKKTFGIEVLETRFEAPGFDYSNPTRESMA